MLDPRARAENLSPNLCSRRVRADPRHQQRGSTLNRATSLYFFLLIQIVWIF